jgi:hypothetical protein
MVPPPLNRHQKTPAPSCPHIALSTSLSVRGCDVIPSSEDAWINLAADMDYVDTLNGERQRHRARKVCGRYSAPGRTTRGGERRRAEITMFLSLFLNFIILSEHFIDVNGWRHRLRLNFVNVLYGW